MNSYKDSPVFVREFIDETISKEGDYSDHKDDLGGKTKFGIIESVARNNGYKGEMKDLPLSKAQDIYASEYYFKPNFHMVADESHLIAREMFDTGVNCGTRVPVKFLQRILNVFNNQETYYEDLIVDGLLGRKTIAAYQKLCNIRGEDEVETVVYNTLNSMQTVYYIELSEKREKNESFTWGWISNRVDYLNSVF